LFIHRLQIYNKFQSMSSSFGYYLFGLFKITNAAITPGTQPQIQSKKTIKIDPHPLPMTDKGGNIIASKTRQKLI